MIVYQLDDGGYLTFEGQQPMCEARPGASLRPGRNPRTCASHATRVVGHGMPHHVCGIHYAAWERACSGLDWVARTSALAAVWGWPDRDTAAQRKQDGREVAVRHT